LGGFLLIVFLIVYIWWPLAEEVLSYIDWGGQWWLYFDWLLVGIFLFMTLLIMSGADLRRDALIVFVGFVGGLVIEGWGTQTNLWFYFTAQRPPLWIIPAWPIASLSIDRLVRFLRNRLGGTDWARSDSTSLVGGRKENLTADPGTCIRGRWRAENAENSSGFILRTSRSSLLNWLKPKEQFYKVLYWPIFIGFGLFMLYFVWPTIDKPLTLMALALVTFLTLTPTDPKEALLNFIAGSGLGYFLELWGTTRECWMYYTFQTPPFFAVLAHGMAAVAFWRAGLVVKMVWERFLRVIESGLSPKDAKFTGDEQG
jgi:hypothetical protein